MRNRLYRSETDRMLAGVSGGLAEYFDIDPVIVRMIWVLGAIFTGGLLVVAYIVMAIITPNYSRVYGQAQARAAEPPQAQGGEGGSVGETETRAGDAGSAAPPGPGFPAPRPYPREAGGHARRGGRVAIVFGVTLLVVGGIALLDSFDLFSFWQPWRLWPVILIAAGLAIVYARRS